MNATKAREILLWTRKLKPEHAGRSASTVARRVRRHYEHNHAMPSRAQVIGWFGRKLTAKTEGATMPIKETPVAPVVEKREPWYKRFGLSLREMVKR